MTKQLFNCTCRFCGADFQSLKSYAKTCKNPECQKKAQTECSRRYRESEYGKAKRKEYRQKNAKAHKQYREAYRERQKAYGEQYRKEHKDYMKIWRKNHKEHIKLYYRAKLKTDEQLRLKRNYLCVMARVIDRQKTSALAEEILGCDYPTFKAHIESKFENGMSWDNYGLKGWCIDHIIPISSFDMTDFEQVKMCFNYKNTQPLWAKDNNKKADSLGGNFKGKEVKAGMLFV